MKVSQFDKYIGQKVLVNEVPVKRNIGGKDYEFVSCKVDAADKVIEDIKSQWPTVRIWLPNSLGTMDLRTDRLNVYVRKQEDGSYEIKEIRFG